MSRVVTTADVLESFANLLYGKARENLEQVLLDRDLLGDVEHGLRGQILHQFATDALVCLRAAGRVAPGSSASASSPQTGWPRPSG